MIFFLDSSFEELQYWSDDHFFWMNRSWILNLFSTHVQFVKVCQNCNVGSQAPKDVSHTLTDRYKKESLLIWTSTHLTHLSPSDSFVQPQETFSLLCTCEREAEDFGLFKDFCNCIDLGSTLLFYLRSLGINPILGGRIWWHRNRGIPS